MDRKVDREVDRVADSAVERQRDKDVDGVTSPSVTGRGGQVRDMFVQPGP